MRWALMTALMVAVVAARGAAPAAAQVTAEAAATLSADTIGLGDVFQLFVTVEAERVVARCVLFDRGSDDAQTIEIGIKVAVDFDFEMVVKNKNQICFSHLALYKKIFSIGFSKVKGQ